LFFRYKFKEGKKPSKDDGVLLNKVAYDLYDPEEKAITGAAIDKVKADVIGLQEVESLRLLDKFDRELLKDTEYEYKMLIDGLDIRRINVAVMSKYPIVSARTHRNERSSLPKTTWLFSRDCLEVEIDVDGKPLFLYVNHFKSMLDMDAANEEEARNNTRPHRLEQSTRVKEIINQKWEQKDYIGNFAAIGDFNTYPTEGNSLEPLLQHPGLVNVIDRMPAEEQWTHFYAKKKQYTQLDYILLSKSLAEQNQNQPVIIRNGLPGKAERYTGERFTGVGRDKPKASDHCPFYMDIELQ
jgi:endonuclease/exonuclease/phosphatase family metal-dependent hydrolase